MVQRVNTVAFQGVEVLDIDVQVQVSPGLPQFNIMGMIN
jgi:magnesium chelatase family protein